MWLLQTFYKTNVHALLKYVCGKKGKQISCQFPIQIRP